MAGDWVKLHRRLLGSEIMGSSWLCHLWVWCLLKASYESRKDLGVIVEPGQFVTTKHIGAASLRVSTSQFYRGLRRLSLLGCVALESNRERTMVTICNWRTYQHSQNESEPQSNHERTTSEPPLLDKEGKKERRKEEREARTSELASELLQVWNAQPFVKARAISGSRFRCLTARSQDPTWLATWHDAIDRAALSGFLRGQNDRGWVADIDWFLRPDSVLRVLEGKYDDKQAYAPKAETLEDRTERLKREGRMPWLAANGTAG